MPQRVTYAIEGPIGVIRMDDGKANAMQGEFLAQFNLALDRASHDPLRALLVLGRERCFSAGLDLKTLPALGRRELAEVLGNFAKTLRRLFLFPAPVVCAAGGHALAGGMILFLAGDTRLALDDDTLRLGLNEVSFGLPLPEWVIAQCAPVLPAHLRTQVLVQAQVLTPKACLQHGIAHELAATPADLLTRALAQAEQLAKLDTGAYGKTKRRLRLAALAGCEGWSAEEMGDLLAMEAFGGKP